jgi:hypothetical protein
MTALPLLIGMMLAAGALLAGLGGLGLVAGRRLLEGLRADPYHREGDALAAYLPGCSAGLLVVGLLALAGGGWLWLAGVGSGS